MLVVFIFLQTQISLAQEFLVATPKVEVRKSPQINEIQLTELSSGEEVVSLARSGEWIKVRTDGNVEGWVRGEALVEAYAYPRALFSFTAVIVRDSRTQEIVQQAAIEPTASWLGSDKKPIRAQELATASKEAVNSMSRSYRSNRQLTMTRQKAVRIIDAEENILHEIILGEARQRLPFTGSLQEFGYPIEFQRDYQAKAYLERRINKRAEIDSTGQLFLLETHRTDYLQFDGDIPDSWRLERPVAQSAEFELITSSRNIRWKRQFAGATANLLNSKGDVKISFDDGTNIFIDAQGNMLGNIIR